MAPLQTLLFLLLATLGSTAPILEDLISQIRSGSRTVVDTRDSFTRSVEGFLPASLLAEEFSKRGAASNLDIGSVIFLVDRPAVESEICTEGITCYTGGMQPFADKVIFPEDVSFQALRVLLEKDLIVLVDVRTPEELVTDGTIPGSVNVPLQEIPAAFRLNEEEFLEEYGFRKPGTEDRNVVLTCRSGRRILVAQERMETLGYNSLRLYRGSLKGWKANKGPLV